MLGMVVASFCSFIAGVFNPYVANKAGPDWMWAGGRDDLVRGLYFRPDGSFRRYGRIALIGTLLAGSATLYWIV